jgi:hypothetical protein
VLVGREDERRRLDGLFAEASSGHSEALIIYGEPGIGKTSLIEYTVAGAAGFKVLRACPLEVESELAFAGLSELLRPILRVLDRIPAPQKPRFLVRWRLVRRRRVTGSRWLRQRSACWRPRRRRSHFGRG